MNIEEALIRCWDIDKDDTENHINFFKDLISKKIINQYDAIDIIQNDNIFNRYEFIDNYRELADAILEEHYEGIIELEEEDIEKLETENDEKLETYLKASGWYVHSHVAVGFDKLTF